MAFVAQQAVADFEISTSLLSCTGCVPGIYIPIRASVGSTQCAQRAVGYVAAAAGQVDGTRDHERSAAKRPAAPPCGVDAHLQCVFLVKHLDITCRDFLLGQACNPSLSVTKLHDLHFDLMLLLAPCCVLSLCG